MLVCSSTCPWVQAAPPEHEALTCHASSRCGHNLCTPCQAMGTYKYIHGSGKRRGVEAEVEGGGWSWRSRAAWAAGRQSKGGCGSGWPAPKWRQRRQLKRPATSSDRNRGGERETGGAPLRRTLGAGQQGDQRRGGEVRVNKEQTAACCTHVAHLQRNKQCPKHCSQSTLWGKTSEPTHSRRAPTPMARRAVHIHAGCNRQRPHQGIAQCVRCSSAPCPARAHPSWHVGGHQDMRFKITDNREPRHMLTQCCPWSPIRSDQAHTRDIVGPTCTAARPSSHRRQAAAHAQNCRAATAATLRMANTNANGLRNSSLEWFPSQWPPLKAPWRGSCGARA